MLAEVQLERALAQLTLVLGVPAAACLDILQLRSEIVDVEIPL